MARWRYPTLTVHSVDVSGPSSNTVIPRSVKAVVSMRIVPNQDLNDVSIHVTMIDFKRVSGDSQVPEAYQETFYRIEID
jgi:acetylornithine deacetylase/succinyl-diaminopimelate desuccinylase-like protein